MAMMTMIVHVCVCVHANMCICVCSLRLYMHMCVCTCLRHVCAHADIPVDVIASFKKMKSLSTNRTLILKAIKSSTLVEVRENNKCRCSVEGFVAVCPQLLK